MEVLALLKGVTGGPAQELSRVTLITQPGSTSAAVPDI